jgi:hypothetical protein
MIVVACAFGGPKTHTLYQALLEGLVRNLREVCPGEKLLYVTDDNTPRLHGIDTLRVSMTMPLMVWRLKAHQMAHEMADEILFVEPDVRLRENILYVFDDKDFDITVTPRQDDVFVDGEKLLAPYTGGAAFSRSAEFWREAKLHCQTLSKDEQQWFGDMYSVAHVVDGGKYRVKRLDGSIYNHIPNDPNEPLTCKVVHYKGKRKAWLFEGVREAA